MSVLQVDTFAPRLGGTPFSHVGIVKAAIVIDVATGSPVIDFTLNITSLGDLGAGDFQQNYTNNFSSINYSAMHQGRENNGVSTGNSGFEDPDVGTVYSTGGTQLWYYNTTFGTGVDPRMSQSQVVGNLA